MERWNVGMLEPRWLSGGKLEEVLPRRHGKHREDIKKECWNVGTQMAIRVEKENHEILKSCNLVIILKSCNNLEIL
jgi:hypothetical protein